MAKSTTEKILDAASAVVLKEGISSITIDGVAAKVGLSKGGVLHHFKTKSDLIGAMVQRTADGWRSKIDTAYEETPEGPGRMARGIISYCLTDAKMFTKDLRNNSSSILAALAFDPKLIAPMRRVYEDLYKRLEEENLPDGASETVFAALDGMWVWWILGYCKIDQDRVDRMRIQLSRLLDEVENRHGVKS